MIDIKKNPETLNKLKVGTTAATPADGELTVSGNVTVGGGTASSLVSGGDSPVLSIGGTDSGLVTGEKAGAISFITSDGSYTTTYSDGICGEITSVSDSATGAAYGLAFHTATTTGTNRAERLRISSTGTATISKPQQETTGAAFSGAALKLLPSSTTNTTGVSSIALSTSADDNHGFLISGHRAGTNGQPTLRISTHFNSDTGAVALTINNDKLAQFYNGITVSGANNWSHITSSNDQSLSIADDAQVQLADVEAGAMMIHIYDRGAGHGAVIFATYFGQPELVAGSSTYFDVADTDGKICVIKSSSSHDVYLKNRRGSTKQFSVLVTAGVLDDF
jgi:hypothetical protein